jgi:hypothetical protein
MQPDSKRICTASVAARLKILNQLDQGLKRKNLDLIRDTFESHKNIGTEFMSASSLESALTDLGIIFHPSDLNEIIESSDLNANGLDLEGFKSLVAKPSPIDEWVRTLPLIQLVSDAMPRPVSCLREDQLRHLSSVSLEQLEVSCDVIKEKLIKILEEHVGNLKRVLNCHTTFNDINDNVEKFQICKMRVGNIGDFHKGLDGRIGKFLHAMI